MNYLVDTNIISELIKPTPNAHVFSWAQTVSNATLYLSVLTVGEIQKGIAKLTDPLKQKRLSAWLEQDLPAWFKDRILPIHQDIAIKWGLLQATAGRSLPVIDSLLAATALHHQLTLVTRNTKDFDFPGLTLLSPWLTE